MFRWATFDWESTRRCGLGFADNFCGYPAEENERDQDHPSVRVSVGRGWEVIAQHNEDYRNRHESVVLGAELRASAERDVEFAACCGRCDHLPLCGKNSHPDVERHDGSE